MDPATLTTAAMGLLIPILTRIHDRTLDRIADSLGASAESKLRALYDLVSARLRRDPYNAAMLEGAEADPSDPRRQRNLQDALGDTLAQDEQFAAALLRLVRDAQAAGAPSAPTHIQIQRGRVNVGRDVNINLAEPPASWP